MNALDSTASSRSAWLLMIVAATILTLTMGVRQSLGLFVAPIHDGTGLSIVAISFALAVGQLIWGVAQPLFGMYADRHGSVGVVRLGGLMLATGLVLAPFLTNQWGLLFALGILSAAGAGAGSFSILIGATSRLLPPERRPFAAGFINAGGSFGQFLFAPMTQVIIAAAGWAAAMFTLAATSLLTLPLARRPAALPPPPPPPPPPRPARAWARKCVAPSPTAATGVCIWAFSPAACTSPFWSPICPARSRSAVCRPRSRRYRWR